MRKFYTAEAVTEGHPDKLWKNFKNRRMKERSVWMSVIVVTHSKQLAEEADAVLEIQQGKLKKRESRFPT